MHSCTNRVSLIFEVVVHKEDIAVGFVQLRVEELPVCTPVIANVWLTQNPIGTHVLPE